MRWINSQSKCVSLNPIATARNNASPIAISKSGPIHPLWPGATYLSILPTNHAIDFMLGFFYPFVSGATVVHLRTLRPEYVREAFPKYKITYVTLVPLVLKNLQKGLQA